MIKIIVVSASKILLISISLLFFLIPSAYADSSKKEAWGDIDSQWLWKPFETKEQFIFYSKPSKTSEKIGKVKKGMWLRLLDIKGNEWYLLREMEHPYRKGWVSSDATNNKVMPLCVTLILPEKALQSVNPHLYNHRDKMPYTTVVVSMETEVGKVNDKIIDLMKLGYDDVYFFESKGLAHPEGEAVYNICVGAYTDKNETERIKKDLENKGYKPFLYYIVNEVADKLTQEK